MVAAINYIEVTTRSLVRKNREIARDIAMSHPRTATEWHARRGATVDLRQRYVPESGQRSTYRLTVPTDYVKTRSWPLVVGFHGWAFAHDSNPGLHAHGLSNGYIVATPTGYKDDKMAKLERRRLDA